MPGEQVQPRNEAEAADPAPWPLTALDVPALRQAGHRPVPLRQFVLKAHSRCNLSCAYCYVYQGPDDTWRHRPARPTAAVMRRTALRIAEHVRAHGLRRIRIDLHGGEPLLTGPGLVLGYADAVREALPADCAAPVTVQTNGTRLTPRVLAELAAADIRVGLSLDGGTAALNARRSDHAGRSSWPAAHRAARLLARHPAGYAGLLCTIDAAADPAEVYASLAALRPPGLDLLLPHTDWSAPPPPGALYGRWLSTVFDLWWNGDPARPDHPRVRLFTEIVALLLGLPSTTESVGLSPSGALVVDTDGAIEQAGSLKSAYRGAAATGLDVFHHSFDDALDHPGVAARQLGRAGLCAACRDCPVVGVCGGGNYTHRYRAGSGFHHPSVYCADLEHLIRHIEGRLGAALPDHPSATLPDRQSSVQVRRAVPEAPRPHHRR